MENRSSGYIIFFFNSLKIPYKEYKTRCVNVRRTPAPHGRYSIAASTYMSTCMYIWGGKREFSVPKRNESQRICQPVYHGLSSFYVQAVNLLAYDIQYSVCTLHICSFTLLSRRATNFL